MLIFNWLFYCSVHAACEKEFDEYKSDLEVLRILSRFNNNLQSGDIELIKKSMNFYEHIPEGPPYYFESSSFFKPQLQCMINTYGEKLKQLTIARELKNSAKKTTEAKNNQAHGADEGIVYFPSDTKCLRRGVTKDGYETYTNTCSTTIKFGYCHVHPRDENDITGCKAESSTFSRSGYNYITQAGGLEPGRTHTKGYAYEGAQVTFLVACRAGRSPLIESFNSKKITAASKANMSCWAFSNTKNAKGE